MLKTKFSPAMAEAVKAAEARPGMLAAAHELLSEAKAPARAMRPPESSGQDLHGRRQQQPGAQGGAKLMTAMG